MPEIIPSIDMLYRRVRAIRRRRKIRHQGTLQEEIVRLENGIDVRIRDAGRPVDVYCLWNVRRNCLFHEVCVTDICDSITGVADRGYKLDHVYEPDAIITRPSGLVVYLEFDSGKQSGKQLEQKFKDYASFPKERRILFVTLGGMERLKSAARHMLPVADRILLATYADVTAQDDRPVFYGQSLRTPVHLPG